MAERVSVIVSQESGKKRWRRSTKVLIGVTGVVGGVGLAFFPMVGVVGTPVLGSAWIVKGGVEVYRRVRHRG